MIFFVLLIQVLLVVSASKSRSKHPQLRSLLVQKDLQPPKLMISVNQSGKSSIFGLTEPHVQHSSVAASYRTKDWQRMERSFSRHARDCTLKALGLFTTLLAVEMSVYPAIVPDYKTYSDIERRRIVFSSFGTLLFVVQIFKMIFFTDNWRNSRNISEKLRLMLWKSDSIIILMICTIFPFILDSVFMSVLLALFNVVYSIALQFVVIDLIK